MRFEFAAIGRISNADRTSGFPYPNLPLSDSGFESPIEESATGRPIERKEVDARIDRVRGSFDGEPIGYGNPLRCESERLREIRRVVWEDWR
jgi:hypothetical protein